MIRHLEIRSANSTFDALKEIRETLVDAKWEVEAQINSAGVSAFTVISKNTSTMELRSPMKRVFRNVSPSPITPGETLTISHHAAKSQERIPAFSTCEPKLIHTDTSTNANGQIEAIPTRGGVAFISDLLTSRFLPLQSLTL